MRGDFERTRDEVGSDVDHDTSRLEPLSLDKVRLADGSNNNVGGTNLEAGEGQLRVSSSLSSRGPQPSDLPLTISWMFCVLEWHWVTVASLFLSRAQTGEPTMSDLPSTTAFLPAMAMPVESIRSITPAGVQGVKRGVVSRDERCPMLVGWNLIQEGETEERGWSGQRPRSRAHYLKRPHESRH